MEFTLNPDGSLASPNDSQGGDEDGARDGQPAAAPVQPPSDPAAAAAGPGPLIGAGGGADPGELIKESDTTRFMVDVVEASMQVPVIVDFWAPWCGPCKQLTPILEKLVKEAAGTVRLVKINIDENQELAAQMRIQSIPAVYAFSKGQPVDGFMGAVPESQIKTFIGRITGGAKTPVDTALEQAAEALDAGDAVTAGAIFAKVREHDPANPKAVAGLIRVAVAEGDPAKAREIIAQLPADIHANADVQAAGAAVDLAEQSGDTGDIAELRQKVAADEGDHQARFDLALALYGAGQNEAAVDELLDLFRRDRKWNDEAARVQLVKIFDALGGVHPVTVSGRKRLSTMMFS